MCVLFFSLCSRPASLATAASAAVLLILNCAAAAASRKPAHNEAQSRGHVQFLFKEMEGVLEESASRLQPADATADYWAARTEAHEACFAEICTAIGLCPSKDTTEKESKNDSDPNDALRLSQCNALVTLDGRKVRKEPLDVGKLQEIEPLSKPERRPISFGYNVLALKQTHLLSDSNDLPQTKPPMYKNVSRVIRPAPTVNRCSDLQSSDLQTSKIIENNNTFSNDVVLAKCREAIQKCKSLQLIDNASPQSLQPSTDSSISMALQTRAQVTLAELEEAAETQGSVFFWSFVAAEGSERMEFWNRAPEFYSMHYRDQVKVLKLIEKSIDAANDMLCKTFTKETQETWISTVNHSIQEMRSALRNLKRLYSYFHWARVCFLAYSVVMQTVNAQYNNRTLYLPLRNDPPATDPTTKDSGKTLKQKSNVATVDASKTQSRNQLLFPLINSALKIYLPGQTTRRRSAQRCSSDVVLSSPQQTESVACTVSESDMLFECDADNISGSFQEFLASIGVSRDNTAGVSGQADMRHSVVGNSLFNAGLQPNIQDTAATDGISTSQNLFQSQDKDAAPSQGIPNVDLTVASEIAENIEEKTISTCRDVPLETKAVDTETGPVNCDYNSYNFNSPCQPPSIGLAQRSLSNLPYTATQPTLHMPGMRNYNQPLFAPPVPNTGRCLLPCCQPTIPNSILLHTSTQQNKSIWPALYTTPNQHAPQNQPFWNQNVHNTGYYNPLNYDSMLQDSARHTPAYNYQFPAYPPSAQQRFGFTSAGVYYPTSCPYVPACQACQKQAALINYSNAKLGPYPNLMHNTNYHVPSLQNTSNSSGLPFTTAPPLCKICLPTAQGSSSAAIGTVGYMHNSIINNLQPLSTHNTLQPKELIRGPANTVTASVHVVPPQSQQLSTFLSNFQKDSSGIELRLPTKLDNSTPATLYDHASIQTTPSTELPSMDTTPNIPNAVDPCPSIAQNASKPQIDTPVQSSFADWQIGMSAINFDTPDNAKLYDCLRANTFASVDKVVIVIESHIMNETALLDHKTQIYQDAMGVHYVLQQDYTTFVESLLEKELKMHYGQAAALMSFFGTPSADKYDEMLKVINECSIGLAALLPVYGSKLANLDSAHYSMMQAYTATVHAETRIAALKKLKSIVKTCTDQASCFKSVLMLASVVRENAKEDSKTASIADHALAQKRNAFVKICQNQLDARNDALSAIEALVKTARAGFTSIDSAQVCDYNQIESSLKQHMSACDRIKQLYALKESVRFELAAAIALEARCRAIAQEHAEVASQSYIRELFK